jgi:hypothetical protein
MLVWGPDRKTFRTLDWVDRGPVPRRRCGPAQGWIAMLLARSRRPPGLAWRILHAGKPVRFPRQVRSRDDPPAKPCIYHITHLDNLAGILDDGVLLCDARIVERGGSAATIGFPHIKQRRLTLPVRCHPDTNVGDYVPFYFCARSVMLYVIHQGGQGSLGYRGGQAPVLHLEADLQNVMNWANGQGRPWAFTKSNAGAYYSDSWCDADELSQINWNAVSATQWSAPDVKEAKQAEFLVRDSFPLHLVARIGVRTMQVQEQVEELLAKAGSATPVQVRTDWYY